MAPKRVKATRASTSHDAITAPAMAMAATAPPEHAHTPEQSPAKRPAGITQAQKQALIDNLQLEITERARKLRAQYAMQAQGLRTRLEMRVNRIPQGLRKRNMQELMDEHAERAKRAPAPPVPAQHRALPLAPAPAIRSPEPKSLKRPSNEITTDPDKETALLLPPSPNPDLPNPKKRAKPTTTATANTKATRTASRKVLAPPNILSPKSHNSRTLPRSPFKSLAPTQEPALGRPASPVKPSLHHTQYPAPAPAPAPPRLAPRAPSRQHPAKRSAPVDENENENEGGPRSSEASNTSAGTTIVTKPAAKRAAPTAAKRAGVAKAAAGAVRKPGAAKKENVAPVAVAPVVAGGRTLRKRG
ncbi:hypothetical protein LTR08_000520 [Meristemomyces frigidus]|nr:hypothetical protein LTR08_000520 [Meristemomyces frigidus]